MLIFWYFLFTVVFHYLHNHQYEHVPYCSTYDWWKYHNYCQILFKSQQYNLGFWRVFFSFSSPIFSLIAPSQRNVKNSKCSDAFSEKHCTAESVWAMGRVKFSLKVPNRLQRITRNKQTKKKKSETFVDTSKAVNYVFVSSTLPSLCRVLSAVRGGGSVMSHWVRLRSVAQEAGRHVGLWISPLQTTQQDVPGSWDAPLDGNTWMTCCWLSMRQYLSVSGWVRGRRRHESHHSPMEIPLFSNHLMRFPCGHTDWVLSGDQGRRRLSPHRRDQ